MINLFIQEDLIPDLNEDVYTDGSVATKFDSPGSKVDTLGTKVDAPSTKVDSPRTKVDSPSYNSSGKSTASIRL